MADTNANKPSSPPKAAASQTKSLGQKLMPPLNSDIPTAVADSHESFSGLPDPLKTIEDGAESVPEPITQVGVQAAEKGVHYNITSEYKY
ncbi:hypothetical protein Sjap_008968 [Stephania japonica]|uniref:Uncharacterized protein n=1 Tax=Stephania japonica TaxID=461633 RepID=A0AAP0JR27_9MAGN